MELVIQKASDSNRDLPYWEEAIVDLRSHKSIEILHCRSEDPSPFFSTTCPIDYFFGMPFYHCVFDGPLEEVLLLGVFLSHANRIRMDHSIERR